MSGLKPKFIVLSNYCFVGPHAGRPSNEKVFFDCFMSRGLLCFFQPVQSESSAMNGMAALPFTWDAMGEYQPKMLIIDEMLYPGVPTIDPTIHILRVWRQKFPACKIVVLCRGGNLGNHRYLKSSGATVVWQYKQLLHGGDEYVREFLRKHFPASTAHSE